MPHDPHDYGPEWDGPYVTLRPVDGGWSVAIEPPPATGEGAARTFGCKSQAWAQAQELWAAHRLPMRDFTLGQTARAYGEE